MNKKFTEVPSEPESLSDELARKGAQIRSLLHLPPQAQEDAIKASTEAAAAFYATSEGQAELADWRALDGEDSDDLSLGCAE